MTASVWPRPEARIPQWHDGSWWSGIKHGLDKTSLELHTGRQGRSKTVFFIPIRWLKNPHGGHYLGQWLINLSFLQGSTKIYHCLLFLFAILIAVQLISCHAPGLQLFSVQLQSSFPVTLPVLLELPSTMAPITHLIPWALLTRIYSSMLVAQLHND